MSQLQDRAADWMRSQVGAAVPLLMRLGKLKADPIDLARTLVGLMEEKAPRPISLPEALRAVGVDALDDAHMVLTKLGHPDIVEQVFWYADGSGFVDPDEVAERMRASDGLKSEAWKAWSRTVCVGWRLVSPVQSTPAPPSATADR